MMNEKSRFAPNGIISLTTDFGTKDGYVGAMKAALLSTFPEGKLVDVGHNVSPQDIRNGAYTLLHAVPYFPSGTIHLAVIDPGVGSARACIAALFQDGVKEQLVIAPDNGLITLLAEHYPVRNVFQFDHTNVGNPTPSNTFHGRDIFAPMAAMIANGSMICEEQLSRLENPILFENKWERIGTTIVGSYLCSDHFGNVISNIPFQALADLEVTVEVGAERVDRLVKRYDEAEQDEVIALEGSMGFLELAKNGDSAADFIRAKPGDPVVVREQTTKAGPVAE